MMELYESVLYGLFRGATSVFPVDADTHEFLLSRLMANWNGGDIAGFTALGVALAILLYYRKYFCRLMREKGVKFVGLAILVSFALGAVSYWKRNMLFSLPITVVFAISIAAFGVLMLQKRKIAINAKQRKMIVAGAVLLFLPGASILGLALIFATRSSAKKDIIRQALILTAMQSLGLFAHMFVGANVAGFDYGVLLIPSLIAMLVAFILATLAIRALGRISRKRNLLRICGYYLVIFAMTFAVFELLK